MRLKQVLENMRGDKVSEEIVKDILIFSWGDDLLKKSAADRSKYHLVAKMRRCANFVKQMREINPTRYTDMLSCLRTTAFFDVIEATKRISKYNPDTRTYGAPSTALQFGTYLKQLTKLAKKILLYRRTKIPENEMEKC